MTKASELREMSDEQLSLTLKEASENLFRMRIQSQTERLDAPSELRKSRRLIARAKEEDILWLRTPPGLKYLSCPICEGFPDSQDLNPDAVRRVLNDLQIKYVVYHRVDFEGLPTSFERDGTAAAIQDYLERVAGLTVIDSDERFIAYRNEGVE